MEQETQPAARTRRRTLDRLKPAMNLSFAAFAMSLTITLLNAYYALKGSDIGVQAPRQVILYRDGEGSDSVLTVGLRTDLINLADGYGDVLTGARLRIGSGAAWFDYQGVIKTVFNSKAASAAASCDLEARCLGLPGLLIVERSDDLIAFPAGAAKAVNLSFPLVRWNCAGPPGACGRFTAFPQSVRALGNKGLELTLELSFQSDGTREILCRTSALDVAYLMKVGWVSLPCQTSRVSGGALF